jgi:poly [ADP-ribose] polymerase 7/11/12/13
MEMEKLDHFEGDAKQQSLFHGTSSVDVIREICRDGFDWRFYSKDASKYGDGSYFARDAKYSNSYTSQIGEGNRFMFLAKVLVGKSTNGSRGVRKPPKMDESDPASECYDSCVDSLIMPTIYVVFDHDQSYPEFLIEYKNTQKASDAACGLLIDL